MEFCENFMPRWKQTRKQISHQVPHWHVFELVYEASARKGLGYFPLSEAKKRNRFFSNLTKLHFNIQPNVFISKFLKFIKAAELFRKTYFQIKVKKSGRWKQKLKWRSLVKAIRLWKDLCSWKNQKRKRV